MEGGMVTPAASFGGVLPVFRRPTTATPRGEEPRPRHQEGRVRHPAWPFGLGQDDHADECWQGFEFRPTARSTSLTGPSRTCRRTSATSVWSSKLRPVSAPDDRGERRLPAVRSQDQQGGGAGARADGATHDQAGKLGAPAARAAVGGQQQRVALAAHWFSNPQLVLMDEPWAPWTSACGSNAARDQATARYNGHHRRLRHPRPERGAHHVGPHRRFQRRHRAADRQAERTVRAPREQLRRQTSSARTTCWPAPSKISKRDIAASPWPPAARSWPRRPTWPAQAPPPLCRCGRERISILNGRGGQRRADRLPATVQNTIYLGDHALACSGSPATRSFMVKLQPGARGGLSHAKACPSPSAPKTAWPLIPCDRTLRSAPERSGPGPIQLPRTQPHIKRNEDDAEA